MTNINCLDDLISLGKSYHCKCNKEYFGVNLKILCDLVVPLTELKNMVGMEKVKTNIINHIIFFLQGFNKKTKCGTCINCSINLPCPKNLDNDMLHTVITGSPGVGKTVLGRILGKVYTAMGILSKGHFTVVARSDLVGKYLGHTAAKTQDVINKCIGGIMFIDEAYALGNEEGRDSFSKECIDTINQNLTEKRDFLCIIAGYKDALEECFFKYNAGLKRRFSFTYDIEPYDAVELKDIFMNKVEEAGWETEFQVKKDDNSEIIMNKHGIEQQLTQLFEDNIKYFPNYGGDVETFFLNCKIYHSNRVVFLDNLHKRILTIDDFVNGLKTFIEHRKFNDDEHKYKSSYNMLY